MPDLPDILWRAVFVAGSMLFVMSVMDTFAYGVRTAGALAKRLAMGLALFNSIVVVSRFANMLQAAVLGTMPDLVNKGLFSADDVLVALRYCIGFMIVGVLFGAMLMPTFIRLMRRGLQVLEQRGSAPAAGLYALTRLHHFPQYVTFPPVGKLRAYTRLGAIPANFLVFNIFVTAFYSIGVMSTILAASWDHDLAGSTIMLSGIVNGIASVLLFLVVDPPASIVIDQAMAGKRPESDVKTLNFYLVATRLVGVSLSLLLLPWMARYVVGAAVWLHRLLGSGIGTA
jgi:Alternate to MurJ